MTNRRILFSTLIFAAAIVPVTVGEGLRVHKLSLLAGGPPSLGWPINAALCFYVSALLGYMAAVGVLSPPSKSATGGPRLWLFPLACGVILSSLAATGVVEHLGDRVGAMIGHGQDYPIIVLAVGGASVGATLGVSMLARVLARARKESQIA